MDQEKIGKFISKKRKEVGLTQSEFAEKLGITDRAVSKWETGRSMPDASLINEVCTILNITINDLFSGEVVDSKKSEVVLEEHLLDMKRLKEETDRAMLRCECFIGYSVSLTFFVLIFIASYIDMSNYLRVFLIVFSLINFFIGIHFCLRIEQKAGYYECLKCHNKYIPRYDSVFFAMHVGRSRYMKCPKCGRWSYNRKVISKDS